MSSSRRLNSRSVFTIADGRPPAKLVSLLTGEDIQLLIDARELTENAAALEELCASAEMYYAYRPGLARLADRPGAEPDADHAWAARMALRHRACVLGEPRVSQEIAALVGLRVIDLDRSPAPIVTSSL